MRLLLTRPRRESEALAKELEAMGHEIMAAPLLEIRVLDEKPELAGVTHLVFTSANGVRSFAEVSLERSLTVYAVGDATAEAAREAGFSQVRSAAGDAEALLRLLREELDPRIVRILHICGRDVARDLAAELAAAGFTVRRQALYEAKPISAMPAYVRSALASGALDGALFFSPRTARVFVCLCEREGLEAGCSGMLAFCLSAAVADALAGLPWADVRAARHPDRQALLALVEDAARARARTTE